MQGIVKWYSVEKRYGFILGEDAIDRYFHERDVSSAEVPVGGDIVTFRHQSGRNGAYAIHVQVLGRGEPVPAERGGSRNVNPRHGPRQHQDNRGILRRLAHAVFARR